LKQNKLNLLADKNKFNDDKNKLLNNNCNVTFYLSKIGLLMFLEEIHMLTEISHYDLHNYKFNFFENQQQFSNNQEILKLIFKVTGSSELRPHIALGNSIRLRPVADNIKKVI
jgi:hypothetical protein